MYNPPQIQPRLKEYLPLNDIEMNLHTCLYPVVKKLEIVRKKANAGVQKTFNHSTLCQEMQS